MDQATTQKRHPEALKGTSENRAYSPKFNGEEFIKHNGREQPSQSATSEEDTYELSANRHPLVNFWNDIIGKKRYKRYLEREDRLRRAAGQIFLLGNMAFGLLYIFWFYSVLNWNVWYVSVPFFIAEIVGLLTATYFATVIWYPRYHRPEGISWERTPTVDVFITTCGEPLTTLERTLSAVKHIDYPHKTVYVLDDAGSSCVKMLAENHQFHYIARARRSAAKAGNLNFGLSQSDGEFILTLDADQIPDTDIIKRLINYFRFPRVGFVQSAPRFILPKGDPFGCSNELFYKVMQPGKDNDNAAFACGSGVIYRRAALENVGGFSTWNLVGDVHTSMKLHAGGWKSIYHNHSLTTGTPPAHIYGVYKQRQQWATAALRLLFWDSPFKYPGLSLKQKLQYFQLGFVYLISGFAMPIYFLIPSWSLLTGKFLVNAQVTDYILFRGIYFLFTVLALTILEHPADSRKAYKIWVGLFPIFIKATIAALRTNRQEPQFAVNEQFPDNLTVLQRFKAIMPQLSIITLTLLSIAYSLKMTTLSLELFLLNTVWGCWVVWSLSSICNAAVKRKTFAQTVSPV